MKHKTKHFYTNNSIERKWDRRLTELKNNIPVPVKPLSEFEESYYRQLAEHNARMEKETGDIFKKTAELFK